MLRILKDQGIDLSKSTFSLYTGPGVTKNYPNAEECLKMLEAMESKRESLKGNFDELKNFKGQVIFNDMGKMYVGEKDLLDVFFHGATKKSEIQKLEEKIKKSEAKIEQMKEVKGQKRLQDRRKQEIADLESNIKDFKSQIDQINEYIPGKHEVRGGGIITTDLNGSILEIEARIGNQPMAENEVLFTLAILQRQGIDLSKISLTTYDANHKKTVHPSAFDYWKNAAIK
jgi:hypothetical protein